MFDSPRRGVLLVAPGCKQMPTHPVGVHCDLPEKDNGTGVLKKQTPDSRLPTQDFSHHRHHLLTLFFDLLFRPG